MSDEFLPELNAMELEQDPIHTHKDVLAHTIAVVAKTSPRPKLRLAALLHDVGKPGTRGYGPQGVTFHYHDVVGARMARQRLLALRYPNEIVEDVSKLVELHLRFHTYRMGWTDSAVRRYVRGAGPLLGSLNPSWHPFRLHHPRSGAKEGGRARPAHGPARGTHRGAASSGRGVGEAPATLDGDAVMEILGVPPGRIVGEAKEFLMEIRLEEGEISAEHARDRLLEWARDRGIRPG